MTNKKIPRYCLLCTKAIVNPYPKTPSKCDSQSQLLSDKTSRKKLYNKAEELLDQNNIVNFTVHMRKFCELFQLESKDTFTSELTEFLISSTLSSTCPLCQVCQSRMELIAKVMATIQNLQVQLIRLKIAVESDLKLNDTRTFENPLGTTTKRRSEVDIDTKTRVLRKCLRKKLQLDLNAEVPVAHEDVPNVDVTSDCGKATDLITITILPSVLSVDGSEQTMVQFDGVDGVGLDVNEDLEKFNLVKEEAEDEIKNETDIDIEIENTPVELLSDIAACVNDNGDTTTRENVGETCKIRLMNQDRLDVHINRFHKNNPIQDSKEKRKKLKCTFVDPVKGECQTRVMSQERLGAHVKRFHKNNLIQDSPTRCVKKPGTPRVDHFRDPMERRKQLKCTFVDPVKGQCKIRFMDQDRLDAHINRFHKSSEKNLVRHKRSKHGEPFPVYCDICKQGFHGRFNLKMHNYKNHGDGNYTHRCSVCDSGFYVKGHLDEHMVKHAEPTFRCDECSKTFRTKSALNVHKRIHTGIRPFVCDVCNWRFHTLQKLDFHGSVHTNKRPFLCQECGFSCRLKKLLHCHLKVHENNKKLAEQGIKKQPRLAKPRNRRLKVYAPSPSFPIPSLIQTSTETEKQQVESENAKD